MTHRMPQSSRLFLRALESTSLSTQRDYYEILSLTRESNGDEVKRAYRRMAMKWHPDRNPGSAEAEVEFKSCTEAYEVLSDPERRQLYDRHGHAGLRQQPGHDFSTMHVEDIFSMFGDIFGGGGGGGSRRGRGPARGLDLETEIEVSLRDCVTGTKRDVDFKRVDVCKTCTGSGAAKGAKAEKCTVCDGIGQVAQAGFGGMFRMVTTCPECRGRRTVVKDKCGECRGKGRVPTRRKVTVAIPPGVDDGVVIRVRGEGEPPAPESSADGSGTRGDLHVLIRISDDEESGRFERRGDDLVTVAPMAFAQAALGAQLTVPTVDGGVCMVDVPPGSQHGDPVLISGLGMPNLRTKDRGDMHVVLQLVVPKKLSVEQRKLLEEYAKTEKVDIREQSSFWKKIKDQIAGD
jgi:molecular chaperone DnaJ